jgi:hypothetical protein
LTGIPTSILGWAITYTPARLYATRRAYEQFSWIQNFAVVNGCAVLETN